MPTPENKALAKLALAAFGGNPEAKVINYREDDNEASYIPILSCPDSPYEKFISYSTVGLSDYPMYQHDVEFHARIELVGACNHSVSWFPNLLAFCAFHIMHSGWLCRPGAVLLDANIDCIEQSIFRHVYFTAPFFWEETLKTVDFQDKKVAWLLAIPITEDEYEYCKAHGDIEFETLLESKNVDVFDLTRESSI
jgi:antitoxin YqcF